MFNVIEHEFLLVFLFKFLRIFIQKNLNLHIIV